MRDRVSDIRRRKLRLYARLLPNAARLCSPGAAIDDLAYLTALASVAESSRAGAALEFGALRTLSDLGLLGHLIASAPTLADTLTIWQRHANMAGDLATMRSEVAGGV